MMKEKPSCQVCGGGDIAPLTTPEAIEYQGHAGHVDVHTLLCSECGSEYANAEQALLNKRSVVAFKKRIDGLLSGDEIRAIRRQYAISQGQAAALFGGGPVAFSKYENDDIAHSVAMDKLLRIASESPDAFRRLVLQAGLENVIPQQQQPVSIRWRASVSIVSGASNDDAFLSKSGATVGSGARVRYEPVGAFRWN